MSAPTLWSFKKGPFKRSFYSLQEGFDWAAEPWWRKMLHLTEADRSKRIRA